MPDPMEMDEFDRLCARLYRRAPKKPRVRKSFPQFCPRILVEPLESRLLLSGNPGLAWSSFLGGNGSDNLGIHGDSIAVDSSGDVYVVGYSTVSWGSPVRAFGTGGDKPFVAKLDSNGNLLWNTFLGGSGQEYGYGIAVDGSGNVYVTGDSSDTWGTPIKAFAGNTDAFVAKLASNGSLTWNTFFGASSSTVDGYGIAVSGSGNVYVTGDSSATWGSPVRAYAGGTDAFAAELSTSGALTWNTFLGSSGGTDNGYGIAVDGSGNVFVGGDSTATWGTPARAFGGGASDGFAAKLTATGSLTWNTFVGGSGGDHVQAVTVDASGNVYLSGDSDGSWGSPVRTFSGGRDAFAAKFSSTGTLTWNTFLGGTGSDFGGGVAVDGSGNVYVAGYSNGTWGSPLTAYTSNTDVFYAGINSSGTLLWNGFLGGGGVDNTGAIALDSSGNIYVDGTSSGPWGSPVRAWSGAANDAFAAKLTTSPVLTSILVSPGSAALHENGTQSFTATADDQNGVALVTQPSFTWSVTGIGSVNSSGLYTAPGSAGSATVFATSGAYSGSATVTVANAAPTVATAASATPNPVTGTTTALSVLGADDGGASNLTYTWAATAQPAGSNPLFSANGTNAAKNSTVTFNKAGSYTFTCTINDGQGGTVTSSVNVTVNQTLTTITIAPTSAALHENATQSFAATANDQFGIAIASQPTFTWTLTGVGSVNSSGLYTAPYGTGSATVKATSGAISGTATVTVTNAAPTVATAASATPNPVTGTTTALSVLGADDGGESNLTYTWAAIAQPAGSNPLFSANGTNAAKNSTVTFNKAGSYTFTCTINDGQGGTVTSSVNVTVNQTLTTITIAPTSAALHENATQSFAATGFDQFGVAMSTQPTFTWTVTGVGSVNSSGLYTAPYGTGSATVKATSGAISGSATVTVTNAAPTVATAASATPNPVTGTTTALSVLGADDGGESNLTYTWSATAQPAGSNPLFSINGTNAAKNSTVTFNKAGSYTFMCTINDGQGGTVTSSVNVTVNQTLTTITIAPISAALHENATQSFAATANDQFGIAMATQPMFAWTVTGVGSVNSSGLYTAPYGTGSATVHATSGAVSGTATVTVTNAAPTVATAASATPNPVTGTTTALSVLGADDGGESNLTYTWSATAQPAGSNPLFSANGTNAAKNSTVTFNKSGSYTFVCTINDGQGGTVTSSVNVTVNQILTTITVTPASSSLHENGTQSFSATGFDQFGVAMVTQPTFTWTVTGVGSVNSSGLYTAPYGTGSATVHATSGAISGTATVTVTNAAPTVATAASATPNPVTGTTTALSVLGADDGGESNLTYTWSATAQPVGSNPLFSANGTNAAKNSTVTFNKAGSYTFTCTINDGQGGTVTSSVNVTVNQTLTTITIAPTSAALHENATQSFAATGFDQFGVAMSTQPTFTWSETGVGSVNSSGHYTAPYGTGSATIHATSGAISGTATVTVTNAAPTVATAASATPNPVTGLSTALSVLGADDGGESNLTYTWSATAQPAGSNPLFSANGNNAAKNSTVTFNKAGSYTFICTIDDGQGGTVTSSVNVTVNQTLTTIAVVPGFASLQENATQSFAATANDQFGIAMAGQPAFTWTNTGVGSVNSSGLYTAAGSAGSATVHATSGVVSGSATVTVTNAAPTVATAASATPNPVTGSTTALSVLGADDNGESALTYTWSATAQPAGSNPLFSGNGSNAAKNSTVTFNEAGSYTFTCTISDGQGGTVTSSVNVIVNQTLATIVVAPGSTALQQNGTQSFGATGFDQFGIVMASQPSFTWTNTGVGSIDNTGLYTAPNGSGSATIQAASGLINGTATVTVTNSAPTVATPASATPNPVTGTTTDLSVLGADSGGESTLTYTWTTTGSPPASVNFSANGTNAAKTTIATFSKAGTYTFQVTITNSVALSATSSVTVTVDATLSSITIQPGPPAMADNTTYPFSATGFDQFGNVLASQPTFTWSVDGGGAGGTVNSAGLYSTPASSTGADTIRATSGVVTATATVTVTGDGIFSGGVDVGPPNLPGYFSFNGGVYTVTGSDAGNTGTSDDFQFPFTTYTGDAEIIADVASVNGTGTTAQAGVEFRDTTASNSAFAGIFLLPGNVISFQVRTVAGASLTSTNASSVQAPQWVKLVRNGNSFSAYYSADGQTWTQLGATASYSAPGSMQVGLAVTSDNPAALSTATVTNVALTPAPTIVTQAAATPNPVTGTSTNVSVLGGYALGESNLTYTWSTTGTPPASVLFADNGDNTAKNTAASFTQAGAYDLLVVVSDGTQTVTSSITVTVNQTLTSITVSPTSSSLNENGTQAFTATGYDQFGAAMSTQPGFTWSNTGVGSVDSSGLYTAPASTGSATVQAANGSISGSATVTVTNSPPTIATGAFASPNPVTGTTTGLSVFGADESGEAILTYTWSATAQPAGSNPLFSINGTNAAQDSTVTFNEAGDYTFMCTISDGQGGTVTSSVNVTVDQTLTTITIAPGSPTIHENATQSFAATGFDQFGNAMATQPGFMWASTGVGTVNSSGLYTAPNGIGSATVQATSGSISGSATVTVTDAAPTVATAAAATPNPVAGTTTALSVLGADDGGESNLTYTWSATAQPAGSNLLFSANGTNSAKDSTVTFNKAGNYTFMCTISDGQGGTITSSVNVTVDQTLATIAVTPGSSSLHENGTQSFSATGFDQFGVAIGTQPTFSWTVTGVGSVNSSGLYTAPYGTGSAAVHATSGVVSGSSTVTVTNAAPTVAAAASATPNPVAGTTTALSVLGADDGGASNLTYTWIATAEPAGSNPLFSANGTNAAKNSTVTFNEVGSYTFTCTISDGQGGTVTSSVNVTVDQTLTTIAVNPASTNLHQDATQSFSAIAFDQFGAAMATQPGFAWSNTGVGAIDSSGLFSSSNVAGGATIRATSGSVTGTANVTVTIVGPTVATPASATPNPVTGTTTDLSILGADVGGESSLTYTWAVVGASSVNFSANGTNAAKNSTVTFGESGIYTFTCTISDAQGRTVTSSVNVTVDQTLTSVTVVASPAPSVLAGGSLFLDAEQFDQFGGLMAQQRLAAWSVDSGSGMVLPDGIFVASDQPGTEVARATLGQFSGTISLTVLAVTPQIFVSPINPVPTVPPAPPQSNGNDSTILEDGGGSGGGGSAIVEPPPQYGPVNPIGPSDLIPDGPGIVTPATPVAPSDQTIADIIDQFEMPDNGPDSKPVHAAQVTASAKPSATQPSKIESVAIAPAQSGPIVIAPINRTELIRELDHGQSEQWDQDIAAATQLKLRVGLASAIGSGAASAYLLWMIRGGGVLASLLSSAPVWKLVDPLFVLPSRRLFRSIWNRSGKKVTDNPEDNFFGKKGSR